MSQLYMTHIDTYNQQKENNQQTLITQSVAQAYQKLHNNIDEMHSKIQHVISKQQSQFVLAYRSHIAKIKKQLQQISKKSEQQEKMFSSNDRIKFLQKQIAVFRQEAIRVYEKLQKVTNQLDIYKRKYQQTVKMYQLSEKSVKQSMRQTKKLFSNQQVNHSQIIKELQQKILEKDRQIQKLKKNKGQEHLIKSNRLLGSIDSQRTYKNRYDKLDSSGVQSTRKSIILAESTSLQGSLYKDIFFQCVKAVKKQINRRKNEQKLDLKNIQNLNDFRQIDKIEVIELFFSNPTIQQWLYQKLFPNPLFIKLQNYKKLDKSQNQSMKITSANFILPKMRENYRKHASKLQYTQKSFL